MCIMNEKKALDQFHCDRRKLQRTNFIEKNVYEGNMKV